MNSDRRGTTDHGGGETNNKCSENLFICSLSMESMERAREYTLSNWPTITPSAQDMCYAGFWYTNIADRVICIHCDAMFHNWTENDNPYEIHRLKSPHCFYIRANGQKTNRSQSSVPVPNASTNDIPNGRAIVGAMHAEYAVVTKRHQTFHNWPESERQSLPSIESFVDAGFFFTGIICFNN